MAGFAPEVLAKLTGLGLVAPMGIGKKFYVNGGADGLTHGNDVAGKGESIATAFLSIAFALTQAVGGRNDYIFCFNTNHQDEAATISIPEGLDYVHIIGLALPGGGPLELNTTGDYPVFLLNTLVGGPLNGVEIAGFNIGGGINHGCIELHGACNFAWIHHCSFGHAWVPAAQDGIRIESVSNSQGVLIEDNWFYGDSGLAAQGKLTRYGIGQIAGSAPLHGGAIRRNYLIRCPTGAINFAAQVWEMVVEDNKIGCGADLLGNGILLSPATASCLIAHNEAHFGNAVMANNPYSDQAGADLNDWMSNQVGSVMKYPDEAM